MRKINFMILTHVMTLSIWAQADYCGSAGNLTVQEFCKVGYATLAKVQALQIQQKVPQDLNIDKMEEILKTQQVNPEDLDHMNWTNFDSKQKANESFKILLQYSGQAKQYLQNKEQMQIQNNLPGRKFAPRLENTTGTRGGGLGNETYILPDGFWVD